MGRRSRGRLPPEPLDLAITGLSHDGRGVADWEGKKVFVHGALPGEKALVKITQRNRRYDDGIALSIESAAADRVEPACAHYDMCGGCALQHLSSAGQLLAKQDSLLQNLERIGKVSPWEILPPLSGPAWHYRRKARLSVRWVRKKDSALVGFRERGSGFVTEMDSCEVLDKRVAKLLPDLRTLIGGMQARENIPQIEVACGDDQCALVFRNMQALSIEDTEVLRQFARQHEVAILLQPKGPDSIYSLEPDSVALDYALPEFDLRLAFEPSDFTQVNAELNRLMLQRAMAMLQPGPDDCVLDLFCGLGNFTLPLARKAGQVIGVEGDLGLVERARANAERNGLDNVEFHLANLVEDQQHAAWWQHRFTQVLIDPPRSGALEVLPLIAATTAEKLLYVSCHPASLARDAGSLVHEHGFKLESAGIMDMFPQTGHVESIALFSRKSKH
ncbi:MAG: 23S rRNA (uracil(1939)-C(5))-methyltransferase RlmD [Xanthomonadales bacterium]|nr:23S rRNA (uracil(1939)-C(5))-methyltransferase RlmD [Xanthomonadales bacterium]